MASIKQALGIEEVAPSTLGLNAWLQFVYVEYLSRNTLELMKFSFRAEIPKPNLEKAHCLLELFYLIKDIYNGNETAALSRLVYTLNLMGHQRFGSKSVRKLEEYGLSKPPEHKPIWDTRGAQLFQCLAKIARHLSDDEEYRIRRYWARTLGTNIKSLSMGTIIAVLSQFVEKRTITEEDQLELANGLNTVGAYKCIKYLIEYRKRNKLPVKEYQDKINPDYKSSTGSSYTYSSKHSIQSDPSRRGTPESITKYDTAQEGSPTPVKMLQGNRTPLSPVMQRFLGSTPFDSHTTLETEVPTESSEHLTLLPQINIDQSVGKGVRLLVVSLLVFAVMVMVGIAGSTYGTIHAAMHQPDSKEQQLLFEQSLVLLADHIHPYYLASVDLSQFVRENSHNIDIYLIDSESEHLNKTTTIEKNQSVDVHQIESNTMYLLQGSVIEYSIRAITNDSQQVLVEAYVLENLEAVWNILQDSKDLIDFKLWTHFYACPEKQSTSCPLQSATYKVNKTGYYSVRFTLNNPSAYYSMKYDYNITITNVSYELPSPKAVIHNCTLTKLDQHCIFTMNESSYHEFWHMNKEVCLLANVHKTNLLGSDESEKKAFAQVDTLFSTYNVNWLIVSVCVLVVLAVLLSSALLLEGIVCYRMYRRCRLNN